MDRRTTENKRISRKTLGAGKEVDVDLRFMPIAELNETLKKLKRDLVSEEDGYGVTIYTKKPMNVVMVTVRPENVEEFIHDFIFLIYTTDLSSVLSVSSRLTKKDEMFICEAEENAELAVGHTIELAQPGAVSWLDAQFKSLGRNIFDQLMAAGIEKKRMNLS